MRKFLVPLCVGLLVLAACAGWKTHAKDAAGVLESTAPLLPPPFGLLAGGLATIISGVASIGANKASNEAFSKKQKASKLVQYATDHVSTIMAVAGPVILALRAGGVIHMSDGELALLLTTFGAPVATQKVMRRKA